MHPRVLQARFSPANHCLAPDGDLLIVVPLLDPPVRTVVSHRFTALPSRKPSQFGWVAEAPPGFDLALLLQPFQSSPSFKAITDASEAMLAAIATLAVGTPVGCDYRKAGLSSAMSLWCHRVEIGRAHV